MEMYNEILRAALALPYDQRWKLVEEVEETLGVKVLGVIPPMFTPEATSAARRIQVVSGAASAVSFLALSAVIVLFLR